VLNKLLNRFQSEKLQYAVDALSNPVDKTDFEYGVHHGVLKGFDLVEQWLEELLEEEEDGENK